MTDSLSHFWITAPYQEDRIVASRSLAGKRNLWYHIDCHQNLGGPYTGTRMLVKHLVSAMPEQDRKHITSYAKALISIAPELRAFVTDVKETLIETASTQERLRFYGTDHSEHLADSLISFILHYISLADLPPGYLVFDNVHAADPLDQRFLSALVRRINPEQLSVMICTKDEQLPVMLQTALTRYTRHICPAPPDKEESLQIATKYGLSDEWTKVLLLYGVEWRGQWKTFGDQKDLLMIMEPKGTSLDECLQTLVTDFPTEVQISLAQNYVHSVCTSDNMLARCAYEAIFPDVKQRLHYEEAQALTRLGSESWALGAIPYHYERGISPLEDGIHALLFATHTCFEKGFYEATIDFGQRGRRLLNPIHDLSHYWEFTKDVGRALTMLHRISEAEELYKEIRALTSDPFIHINIAYALAMHYTRYLPSEQRDHITAQGWLQQALAMIQLLPPGEQKALEHAFHLNALALVKMNLGEKQVALRLVQEAMDLLQSEISSDQHALYRSVLLANRGQLYAYLEQWEQALLDFAEVIRQDPYYEDTYFKRAQLYYRRKQYEEALQDMTTGIANSFPSADLFTGRANLLKLMGRTEEALVDYTVALDITPTFTDALLHRAELYCLRGQYEAALQDYTTGITDGHPSFELFYNRAHLLDSMGRYEEALADYAAALNIAPTAIDALVNRTMIFYEQGAYEMAQSEVERGLQINSNHSQLLCIRGLIEKAMQENERAYQTFTLALKSDPSLVEAWTNRATIAYEEGKVDAAIADLTQALSLEENVIILSNRAHAYQAQQQWEAAIQDYTSSLALIEDNPAERQELLYQRALCYFHTGHFQQGSDDIKAHLALGTSPYLDDNVAEDIKKTDNHLPRLQQCIKSILQPIQEQSIATMSIESYRAAFDTVSTLPTQPNDVTIEALEINELHAEWLLPTLPLPEQIILYFHSGTYIDGSLQTDRALASLLARITRTKVLQIAYRLAPEYPFPTAIYDGLAAYRWLLAHGYAPEQIALVGSTAGAGIALAVLLLARDQGIPLPVVAACLSPWIDLTAEGLSAKSHITTDIVFNSSLLTYAARHYIRLEDASQPLASPLYADLSGLPPLFLQVGENEILHDDAYRLAERAKACNVKAPCITWENMFHGWQAFADVLPFGRRAIEQIAAYFEKYFALAKGTWLDNTIIS